jgi:diadenosine tetraphosphate (Ap4A) HIT family hydrolase
MTLDDQWKQDRIGSALRGENPTVLGRLPEAFAVIGDAQFLPGYCVLLVDDPGIDRLTDLPRARRLAFLESMDRLGEAVERACRERDPQFRRMNYEILGNTDAYLHAHVRARYEWEPEQYVGGPATNYPWERFTDPASALGPDHDDLRATITTYLMN